MLELKLILCTFPCRAQLHFNRTMLELKLMKDFYYWLIDKLILIAPCWN